MLGQLTPPTFTVDIPQLLRHPQHGLHAKFGPVVPVEGGWSTTLETQARLYTLELAKPQRRLDTKGVLSQHMSRDCLLVSLHLA